jgi:hypothetical protein
MRRASWIIVAAVLLNIVWGDRASAQTPFDTLVKYREQYPSVMTDAQLGDLLNRVAWTHRAEGMRLLGKKSGAHCPTPSGVDISCDYLVHAATLTGHDVLTDNGTANVPPTHNGIPKGFDWGPGPEDLREAILTGARSLIEPTLPDGAQPTPVPTPVPGPAPTPGPVFDIALLAARLAAIEQAVADIRQQNLVHETAEAQERAQAAAFRSAVGHEWEKFGKFVAKYGPIVAGAFFGGKLLAN